MNNDMLNLLLEGLTPKQAEAVKWQAEGRLRIAAGAGSGKTEVLTRRIAALLLNGIRAEEIVAITYTQKAAAEMKARLVNKRRISPARLRNMEVSTFHAFMSRFLKQDPFGAGIDRSVTVVEENNKQLIMADLIDKFAEMFGEQIIFGENALGAEIAMKLINEFPAALSRIRRFLLKPAEFYNQARQAFKNRDSEVSPLEKNSLEWLFRFYSCYLEELDKRGLLDFDEILLRGRNLVKEQRQAGSVPQRRIFLIDEFQDNNPEQLEIVNLFCRNRPGHISVVGDEKQSIYSFQGANVETFRNFPSDKDIILTDNFRSYREIISFADAFLEVGGDCGKMFARQQAHRGDSPRKPALSCLLTSPAMGDNLICEQLAEMIHAMADSGMQITDKSSGEPRALRYGDIAVIVGSIRGLPRSFEDALATRKIPYVMSGGFSFYARSEIDEILAFLKLLAQPNDDHAAAKILTGPLYGLDDSELAGLASAGRLEKTSLIAHILAQNPESLPQRAMEFRNLFVDLKEKSANPGLLHLCHTILEQAGFYEFVAAQKSELKRRRMSNNIGKFLSIVRNFEQNGIFTSLLDFLQYVDRILMSDIEENEAGLGLEEGDALKVMTIHKSKGLEFPVVICPFLKKRSYKARSKILFDREFGLLVKDPSLAAKESASPEFEGFIEAERRSSASEDRRKLYVAFTRAEDILILCGEEEKNQPPMQQNADTEPIYDAAQILESRPELGVVKDFCCWPELLPMWLEGGQFAGEKPAEISDELPQADIAQLSENIRNIAAFLADKNFVASEIEAGQEIYSLQDVNSFRACPRRYFFSRQHVTSFIEQTRSFSGTVGTLVHETIRIFHAADGHDLQEGALALAEATLTGIAPFYGDEGKESLPIARKLVQRYVESELGETAPWMIEAEVNVKFDTGDTPFFIRGFADRVDRLHGSTRIIDFKTRKFSAEAHQHYKNQLALYRIAASRGVLADSGTLDFARSYIAYISPEKMEIVEIEPDLESFEKELLQTVKKLREEKTWEPAAGEHCKDCGYAILCHGKAHQEINETKLVTEITPEK